MNSKLYLWLGLGALGIAAIVLLARRNEQVLIDGLPPRVECFDQWDALGQAGPGAIPVLGTGSMAPYIPAAPAGVDPLTVTVAYVAVKKGASYADIKPGNLVVYAYAMPDGRVVLVLHGAAQLDGDGWIMSGLHNERSESWARVTSANFRALAERVYVWPKKTN